ncbi:YEATS-associated helix-containing protein [Paenibacillus sp. 22594]|uniref:YEATS-associated helix-containing protein n=1 Tax=Paenibacillus sp. 22594 TaxID=3453947 RepID=UPI003F851629
MSHIFLIIILLVVSGVFGGAVNFLSTTNDKQSIFGNYELLKSILIGVAASLLVPLFLNTISSNLIPESESDPNKLLVLIGFCLVASISSKSFIQLMTNKMMKEINEMKSDIKDVAKEMEVIVSKETEEGDENIYENIESRLDHHAYELKNEETLVLNALSNGAYIYRSLNGIHKATELSKESINMALNSLLHEGYVEQTTKAGSVRFFVTKKGRGVLFAASSNNIYTNL